MYIGSSFTIFPRSLKQAAHGAYRVNIDINIFNETWGLDREEHFILPSMDRIFLSGGNTNQGVGIAISRRMMKQISRVFFMPIFFSSLLFSRKKGLWCRAVLLGSLQAQTVFILASLQMCCW